MKNVLFLSLFIFCSSIFSIDLLIEVIDKDLELPLEGVKITEINSGLQYFTDFNGQVVLEFDRDINRAVIIAELIGYEPRKQLVTNFNETLTIELLMEGILEGEELVIEAEQIGETDEEIGISTVIEREIIESASKMGIIEDVVNAVKILPGVSYSGNFGAYMSVRGSDPNGLTAVMDGFVTKYPNHWGGAFSIFNPNIVESIKFSPGIFSVKNGQATSALLEVKTIDPTDGLKYSGVLSTSTLEAFGQFPLDKDNKLGILTGFRFTNYELAMNLVKSVGDGLNIKELSATVGNISKAPYIYDFYLKSQYNPSQSFKWYLNGFWGNDGVGIKNIELGDKTKEIANGFNFFYLNSDFFISTGISMLPTEKLHLNFLMGYENWENKMDANFTEEGYRAYSDSFKKQYPSLPSEGFSIFTKTSYTQNTAKQGIQGRLDLDYSLTNSIYLQFGGGSSLDFTGNTGAGNFWTITQGGPPLYKTEYKSIEFKPSSSDSRTLTSFLYVNLNSSLLENLVKIDSGIRVDHSLFMADNYTLNTYPEISPRINVTYSPNISWGILKNNSFSIGTGLFNKNPFESESFSKDLGIKDFEMKSEKSFTNVVGWQTYLPLDMKFKIEGYYKYIYDIFYSVNNSSGSEVKRELYFDGVGHAAGGDLMLDKKSSGLIDGLFSYTFIYARYLKPNAGNSWYYPGFHRFNSLNLLLNIKPTQSFTITSKLAFATGTPSSEPGEITSFQAEVKDKDGNSQIAEMYTRSSYYSDTLRSNISLPLDIKVSYHNYFKNSKYQWEAYLAIQDILSPLLSSILPRSSTQFSKWSGEIQEAPSSGFSFPIITVGFSMSF